MKYICVTKCYFHGKLYEKGDSAAFAKGVKVPEHFKATEKEEVTGEPQAPKPPKDKDPKDKENK